MTAQVASVQAAIPKYPEPHVHIGPYALYEFFVRLRFFRAAKKLGLEIKGTAIVSFEEFGLCFHMPCSRLADCTATNEEELLNFLATENAIAKVSQ